MIDADVLQKLENALLAYQQEQETLQPVVALCEQLCGPNWTSELSATLETAWADNPNREELLKKAEHAVHYYGALAAWDEASRYLSGALAYTKDSLSERLPILEYWLGLFGDDGANLLQQVKDLLNTDTTDQQLTENTDTTDVTAPIDTSETTEVSDSSQIIEVVHPAASDALDTANSDEPVSMPLPVAADEVVSEESILDQSAEKIKNQNIQHAANMPAEQVTENENPVETEMTVTEKDKSEIVQDASEVKPLEAETVLQTNELDVQTQEVDSELPKESDYMNVTEEVAISDVRTADEPVETQIEETQTTQFEENTVSADDETKEDVTATTENLAGTDAAEDPVAYDSPQMDKAIQELDQLHALYENKEDVFETGQEKTQLSRTEMPVISSAEDAMPKKATLDTNEPNESRNWDIANFLRLNKLYNEACNWLSAWCIHMDNADKASYPYYGFIVDLMYDLKEKVRTILDNQLLDEIVEQDVSGGRETLEKIEAALDKEIEGLPDDYKQSTAEKIKLSAQEILGKIDTSTETEDIGAPPDGFELIDDPYAVSTDKIISDFEKTEQETQNQLDKLNVVDKNV